MTEKEPYGKEFTCIVTRRRFIRTDERRCPKYQEFYETYPGACITEQAQFCHEAFKGYIVTPKYQGDSKK